MKYTTKTLKNGVRSITVKRSHTDLCAITLFVRAGSRYDTEFDLPIGIAHFVEHILFKSCKNMTSQGIFWEIESCGGKINAGTTREYSMVQVTIPTMYMDNALRVIKEIVHKPIFNKDAIAKEKKTVLGEIRREKDRFSVVWNLFYKNLWKEHPFRNPILGDEKSIKKISARHIRKFYDACYCGSNMVISVASSLTDNTVQKKIKKIFTTIKKGKEVHPQCAAESKRKRRGVHLKKNIHQTHVILGFETCHQFTEDRYVLRLIEIALGGDGYSRLFRELREKRQLIYSIDIFSSNFEDTGYFATYFAALSRNVEKIVHEIFFQTEQIRAKGLRKEELVYAKAQYRGNILKRFETNLSVARILGVETLLRGEFEDFDKAIGKVASITNKDITRVAQKYLHIEEAVMVAVGS